jgi:hypothetical protein
MPHLACPPPPLSPTPYELLSIVLSLFIWPPLYRLFRSISSGTLPPPPLPPRGKCISPPSQHMLLLSFTCLSSIPPRSSLSSLNTYTYVSISMPYHWLQCLINQLHYAQKGISLRVKYMSAHVLYGGANPHTCVEYTVLWRREDMLARGTVHPPPPPPKDPTQTQHNHKDLFDECLRVR